MGRPWAVRVASGFGKVWPAAVLALNSPSDLRHSVEALLPWAASLRMSPGGVVETG